MKPVRSIGASVGAAGLALACSASVGVVIAGIAWGLWRLDPANVGATSTRAFSAGAVGTTAVVCAAIAVIATVLGLPGAWSLRRASGAWQGVLAAPLLLPMYLAYSGWGVLRAPGSVLGEWLSRGDASRVLIADRVFAIGGLALWAWPIASFVVGAAARRVPQSVVDALALEPATRLRRATEIARMLLPSMGVSAALIALVMAGSAVPLHLAQVRTYAIHLWLYMSLTPEPVRVWSAAWPLAVVAALGAWVCVRAMSRGQERDEDGGDPGAREAQSGWRLAALAVWALAVVVPMGLYLWSLHEWASLARFWRESGEAFGRSAGLAGAVGAIGLGLCLCAWCVRSVSSGGVPGVVARVVMGVFIGAALVPGVLIGSAVGTLCNATFVPREVGDTDLPLILAHVARFGFLAVVAGWWLGGAESAEQRDSRRLYAPGAAGWWRLRVLGSPGAPVGVALACAALSMHEIEASVQVQAPGAPILAQRLLDLLHYSRDEQLAAASVNMVGLGVLVAITASVLVQSRRTN